LLILKEGKLTKQEEVINEEKTFPMMIDGPLSKILKTYIVLWKASMINHFSFFCTQILQSCNKMTPYESIVVYCNSYKTIIEKCCYYWMLPLVKELNPKEILG
jgi:hypothetical protein